MDSSPCNDIGLCCSRNLWETHRNGWSRKVTMGHPAGHGWYQRCHCTFTSSCWCWWSSSLVPCGCDAQLRSPDQKERAGWRTNLNLSAGSLWFTMVHYGRLHFVHRLQRTPWLADFRCPSPWWASQVLSYYFIVRPDRRCDARASQSETVEEVMQHQVFSWYNCSWARGSCSRNFDVQFCQKPSLRYSLL